MNIQDDELTVMGGWTDDDPPGDEDVRAAGALYAAATLEQLALIDLVERLNELNQNKLISIGAGQASNLLHEFWDKGFKRMTARRRGALFARVLGSGSGDATQQADANDAFAGLLRTLAEALAGGSPAEVRPAATALRDNLAEHTDEQSTAAAAELRATFAEIAATLSDMELRTAYSADDMWQLVEHVGNEQFCGERDIERARALAASGALILRRLPELAAGEPAGDGLAAAKAWLAAHDAA